MRNVISLFMMAAAVVVGLGCAVRSDVPRTRLAIPAQIAAPGVSDAAVEAEWWRQFDDPVLNTIIADAFAANRDIAAAAARVIAAREFAGAARARQLPTGGVSAGAARQHLSQHESGASDLPTRTVSTVDAGLAVSWEADVFGRIRAASRAAAADARAVEQDGRGVQIAVVAEVAAAYFELRGAERELLLVNELRERSRAHTRLVTAQVEAGRITRLDLLRAQQIEEELAIDHAIVTEVRDRSIYRLATLTGRSDFTWRPADAMPQPLRATPLAIGTPLDLLKRRPDVASAEVRVVAAAARAGVARADLYPRVDISGSIGLVAGSVGTLGAAAAGSWLIAPRIAWGFLDWPQLRRRARAADALTDAAFAEYEQTLLRALEETRAGITAYASALERLRAAHQRADAAASALTIVAAQYREGFVDSLSRTVAERDAIAASLGAERALTSQRLAVVNVYRALGGGWR
jgi:multidrug efflux system outer membrane protein